MRRTAVATSCVLGASLLAGIVIADGATRERLLVAAGAALFGWAIVITTLRMMDPDESLLDRGPSRVLGIAGLFFLMAVLFIADAIRSP